MLFWTDQKARMFAAYCLIYLIQGYKTDHIAALIFKC